MMQQTTDIDECLRAEEALRAYSEQLEEMVEERTRELIEAQAQLLDQQRLERELELAEQVQQSLLPRQVPIIQQFGLATAARPARYVSGDLYDFILPDPKTCHIMLADISGKGVPAALLALTARTLFRAETAHDDSPARMLSSVNASFYEDLAQAAMFITFFAARLDAQLGTLTYASAGHTEALWWQRASRNCRKLSATGLPIGIEPDTTLDEEVVALRPGDAVIFYSDGITEAANPKGELYGVERLIATVSEHADLAASDLAQVIVEAVEAFRADAPRSDDLTLVVLKALPRTLSFAYPATLDQLDPACAFVRQAASVYGDDFAYEMELATCEIASNVIRHAYAGSSGQMRGQIAARAEGMELDLYDDGEPFDFCPAPGPESCGLQEGGYGLSIVEQLTDELHYTPATPNGNHWRLVKHAQGR